MAVLDPVGSRSSLLQKRVRRFAAFFVLAAVLHGDFWEQGHPQQPVKIFAGVTYGCERLAVTQEGGGLVHWVRVDLTAPGVELYVTPLDPAAVAHGWQYRLRSIEDVVEREHLAVAVNGTYFATASGSWLRFSGDLARSMQTLIADHVIAGHGGLLYCGLMPSSRPICYDRAPQRKPFRAGMLSEEFDWNVDADIRVNCARLADPHSWR
jgi:hypothetical protein